MRKPALLLLLLALAAAAIAARLFPIAFPIVAISDRIGRDAALQRADSFISANALAPDSARRVIQFTSDDSLRTFIELAGGGKDTLDALLRQRDVSLYAWVVRAFVPGDAREVRVRLAPDGRIIGVDRILPDSLVRPTLDDADARRLADSLIGNWLAEPLARWRPVTSSYITRTPGGRRDLTFTYEGIDRSVSSAPIRLDAVIAGDMPARLRSYVLIPESFARRYSEMRSANGLLSLLATFGILGCFVLAMVSLRRAAKEHAVRWRAPLVIGAVGGTLVMLALLNQLPQMWFGYDTAGSPELHQFMAIATALTGGAGTLLLLTLTLAAAEALTRQAFPWHIDWWKYWRYRGTREVAGRIGGGYAMAAFGFAWVTIFYLFTRGVFGWWVPSELIDDPNLIATRLPWVGAIGLSLQAAVSEEALFRAVPLSLLAIWARNRDDKERWMAAGVIATALVFGFAHSDYPSWPPYSRGVEIFLEACVWGALFLRFGILTPIIAHFVYDLVLFGLFASVGSEAQYRVSAVILGLALLGPALSVLWAVWRQGGWIPLGTDATFGEWHPTAPAAPPPVPVVATSPARTLPGLRLAAPIIAVLALAGVVIPRSRDAGPAFTAPATRIRHVADSALRSRGLDPADWRFLSSTARDTLGHLRRFLRSHDAESVLVTRSGDFAIPAWWIVRYVRSEAALEQRGEEWRIRVLPDGRLLDVRHLIPESMARDSITADSARRLAAKALDSVGISVATLRELEFVETPRPARRDVAIAYSDTSIDLPDAATTRVGISIAGDEVISIRREIRLPEAWIRESRGDEQRAMAYGGLLGLPAVALIIAGMVRSRHRPMIANDDLSRRGFLVMLAVFAVASTASSLQSLPSSLALYDTAVPWDRFMATVIGGQVMSLVGVLVIAAFWLLANGMRRRAGIPLIADRASPGMPDDLHAAIVLGGIPVVMRSLGQLLQGDGIPTAPQTTLDAMFPVFTRALAVVPDAVGVMLAVSIPALALTMLSTRRVIRGIGTVAFLGFLAGAVLAFRLTGEPGGSLVRQLIGLAGSALFVVCVATLGRVSVLSWLLAALFYVALGNVSFALHAPTGVERIGGILGALVATALIAAGARIPARSVEHLHQHGAPVISNQ